MNPTHLQPPLFASTVDLFRTSWDPSFDHPYAGALKSNGTGIYCRPCQRCSEGEHGSLWEHGSFLGLVNMAKFSLMEFDGYGFPVAIGFWIIKSANGSSSNGLMWL